jgi:hypothetical protein
MTDCAHTFWVAAIRQGKQIQDSERARERQRVRERNEELTVPMLTYIMVTECCLKTHALTSQTASVKFPQNYFFLLFDLQMNVISRD